MVYDLHRHALAPVCTKVATSFAAVVMFTEPGRARLLLCVSVSAPPKISVTTRPSQEFVEAIAVIVVVPVMLNTEAVEGGVIVALEAMLLPRLTSCRVKA